MAAGVLPCRNPTGRRFQIARTACFGTALASNFQGGRRRSRPIGEGQIQAFLHQQFCRLQPLQLGFDVFQRASSRTRKRPGSQFQPGQGKISRRSCQRGQQVVLARFEQGFLGDRTRGDHAYYFALDQALARHGFADLFANGRRFAQAHQPGQVIVERVVRHARHRDRRAAGFAARGQGDVEQLRRAPRVVVKDFVEIAHAKQQQSVGKLRLDAEVLLHQGRVSLGAFEIFVIERGW